MGCRHPVFSDLPVCPAQVLNTSSGSEQLWTSGPGPSFTIDTTNMSQSAACKVEATYKYCE